MKNELELKTVLSDFSSSCSKVGLLKSKSKAPKVDFHIPRSWKGIKPDGFDNNFEPVIIAFTSNGMFARVKRSRNNSWIWLTIDHKLEIEEVFARLTPPTATVVDPVTA